MTEASFCSLFRCQWRALAAMHAGAHLAFLCHSFGHDPKEIAEGCIEGAVDPVTLLLLRGLDG